MRGLISKDDPIRDQELIPRTDIMLVECIVDPLFVADREYLPLSVDGTADTAEYNITARMGMVGSPVRGRRLFTLNDPATFCIAAVLTNLG